MRNLTLLTDLYEMTMMDGYLRCGSEQNIGVFDIFYRQSKGLHRAVACGLEQAIDWVKNIHFSKEDIEYLEGLNIFSKEFIKKLENFKFTGDIYAVPEGTIVFPYEPILTVKAPMFEAQFLETALLNIINHQTLIATKARTIVDSAYGASISEFGLRRAQGPDAGIYGTRATYVGGCGSTSNVLAGEMFDIPVKGTIAHSWVMSFPDEITAFREYARQNPDGCLLLVDTYDTLKQGVPNAIKVFDELKANGHKPVGIRIDSGDLAYLSKEARKMLDKAGHEDAKIFASGDIDENILESLHIQGAKIDIYGIGTRMITSYDNPSLGGVYKLAAIEENGVLVPKMKISNTTAKITNPGLKKTVRIYDENGKARADLICLKDEEFDTSKPLTIFDPEDRWKETTFTNYTIKELMVDVIKDGKLVYDFPTLKEVGKYANKCIDEFYPEYRRLMYPHKYKVDLSDKLYTLKQELLTKATKR